MTRAEGVGGIGSHHNTTIIGETTMSSYAEDLRRHCLELAAEHGASVSAVIARASAYYDFITGTDRAALADEAKAAIDRAVG